MRKIQLLIILMILGFSIQAQTTSFEVGDIVPAFNGIDQNGKQLSSAKLLEEGDLVVVFYRGAWCGHCQKHMSELEDSLERILDLGASVIAVTPEEAISIKKTEEKSGATFSIIHDKDYTIMKSFDVLYHLNEETVPKFLPTVMKRTALANGNDDNVLPVPATFVLGKNHEIKWMHFDPDYSNRAPISDILKALKN